MANVRWALPISATALECRKVFQILLIWYPLLADKGDQLCMGVP